MLSIQSQLVYGYAGNSAAVPTLQRAGIDVSAVPTVLLSNNPHYPESAGGAFPAADVRAYITMALRRTPQPDAVITGFLGDGAIAEVVAATIEVLHRDVPDCPVICDPVLGDEDVGRVLDDDVLAFLRERLIPQADIITPNRFELAELLDIPLPDSDQAVTAARRLLAAGRPQTAIVTGLPTSGQEVLTLAITAKAAWSVRVPHVPVRPVGTGDVFTALFAVHRLQGLTAVAAMERAVAGVHGILERTHELDRTEMALVANGNALIDPPTSFTINCLG